MTRRRRWLGLLAAALLLTCGESTEPPTPGWIDVRLDTPNTDDGGIIFVVSGGQIDSVRSALDVFSSRQSETSWRVLVAGNARAGVIAQLWVQDVTSDSAYAAVVEEVASRTTFEQRPLSGYALTVQRP